jgi:hypothetical protein
MVKRTMNGKRLLIVAALAAFASFAAPAAYAATLSNTVPIQVKWNTQAIGSLVLHTNYVPATGLHSGVAPTILLNADGGAGSCPATGATNVDGTVDFGAVSADIAQTTNCQYINAVNAIITTADPTGYTLGEFATAPLPAGYNICLLQNGTWNNNVALPSAGAGAAQSENAGHDVENQRRCNGDDRDGYGSRPSDWPVRRSRRRYRHDRLHPNPELGWTPSHRFAAGPNEAPRRRGMHDAKTSHTCTERSSVFDASTEDGIECRLRARSDTG